MNTVTELIVGFGTWLHNLNLNGWWVLYMCVGFLVAGHASYHNSYRGSGYLAHVLSLPAYVFLWWLVLGVRVAVWLRWHTKESEGVYVDGNLKDVTVPISYRHYVSEHTFEFIMRNKVNTFLLDAAGGEIASGKLLEILEFTPLNEPQRSLVMRMSSILDCEYTEADYNARKPEECTDNRPHGHVYLVVCDIDHRF